LARDTKAQSAMTPSIALTCFIIRFLRRPLLNDLGRLAAWAVHSMQEKEVTPHFILRTITIQEYPSLNYAPLEVFSFWNWLPGNTLSG
jgi:hypothetical protein